MHASDLARFVRPALIAAIAAALVLALPVAVARDGGTAESQARPAPPPGPAESRAQASPSPSARAAGAPASPGAVAGPDLRSMAPAPPRIRALPGAPVAARKPRTTELHGDRLVDDYFWLREKADPEVIAYLESENAYAGKVLAPLKPLENRLYDEMLARIKQSDLTVPYRIGDFLYYTRTEEGKQYRTYCRKRGSLDAPEEVLLDVNRLAEGQPYMGIGAFEVSDDGNLLAFATDNTGYRQYTLQVKDLRTGAILPDRVERTVTATWAGDNRTLFYTTEDDAKRSYRLWRHSLGSATDDLVYEEKDPLFGLYVYRTRSRKYVMLGIGSHTTSETRYVPAADPAGAWKIVAPRVHEREYDVEDRGDLLYLKVNDTGRNFRLVTAPIADPRPENWTEVVPHRADVMLEGVDVFANHLVLTERRRGIRHLRVMDLATSATHEVEFPEPVYTFFLQNNHDWNATAIRYAYQSFITPPSVYDWDMTARTATLLKREEVLGGYDPARYVVERLEAPAKDGVLVPISLVRRRDVPLDRTAPMLLGAYGSYGAPRETTFASSRLSLLDRGVVVATAHIRGGGEMGKAWHDDGRMMKKMNTFTDFIACAEFLIDRRYASKERLVIEGGSAGGLLMGAVTNLRPDLFKAVVSHVPFVDVINTMLDPSIPLTVGEFEEWGNPKVKDEYAVMKRYCPYTNLARKDYPTILVKTSLNDSQVGYWEPAKYVAKLRSLKADGNPLVLLTNMGAGHGGASGRYDKLREVALDYAFMLDEMGIRE